MSKRIFTQEEQQLLRQNPHIASCSERSITFTSDFKRHVVSAYHEGHMPKEIFVAAGIPVHIIGQHTPKDCLCSWRRKDPYSLGMDGRGKHSKGGRKSKERIDLDKMSIEDRSEYFKAKIAYMEAENDFLARTRGLKRMPPFEYHPGNDSH